MNQILDYEIILLLAKHGEKAVIASLAKRLDLSPDDVERRLAALGGLEAKTAKTRKQVDTSRIVESIACDNPDKGVELRLLFTRFQNRTFLPELRDVRRFFERHGHTLGRIKSRVEVAPRLFKLLATLDRSELVSLCESPDRKYPSSLGVISDQIMRRNE